MKLGTSRFRTVSARDSIFPMIELSSFKKWSYEAFVSRTIREVIVPSDFSSKMPVCSIISEKTFVGPKGYPARSKIYLSL